MENFILPHTPVVPKILRARLKKGNACHGKQALEVDKLRRKRLLKFKGMNTGYTRDLHCQ